MHTYMKHKDNKYHVGMWLPRPDGITGFCPMFICDWQKDAVRLVNILNGGSGTDAIPIFREYGE